MSKDNNNSKDKNDIEDEDLLEFEFDEDFLDEEEVKKEKEPTIKTQIIDLVDIVKEGHAPEVFTEEIEGLEDLLLEEEESTQETVSEEEKDVTLDLSLEEEVEKEDVESIAEESSILSEYPSDMGGESDEEDVLVERAAEKVFKE